MRMLDHININTLLRTSIARSLLLEEIMEINIVRFEVDEIDVIVCQMSCWYPSAIVIQAKEEKHGCRCMKFVNLDF